MINFLIFLLLLEGVGCNAREGRQDCHSSCLLQIIWTSAPFFAQATQASWNNSFFAIHPILNRRNQIKSCYSHLTVSSNTSDTFVQTQINIVNSKFTFGRAFLTSQKLMIISIPKSNTLDGLGHLYRLSSMDSEFLMSHIRLQSCLWSSGCRGQLSLFNSLLPPKSRVPPWLHTPAVFPLLLQHLSHNPACCFSCSNCKKAELGKREYFSAGLASWTDSYRGQASFTAGTRAVERYEQAPFFAAKEAAGLNNPIIKPFLNIHNEKWSILELVLMGKVTYIAQLP